ncbi:MAG: extracellular solute-binding protein [Lachnospiraceae bacterium]|nr:extracellular solute-binding protein [Lachnospiraceae bacterium]
MGKRILSILIVICALAGICFVGFSGMQVGEEEEQERDMLSFRKKETIYFWYSDSSMTDYLSSAAVAFGELHEDARVIPHLVSDSEYLEAVNAASLSGEQMPDVYLLSNDSLGKAYLAGLASRIEDEAGLCTTEHFPQTALSAVTYKDRLVAYPYYYETSALLYNKTYLEAWTAAQLASQGEEEEDEPIQIEEGEGEGEDDGEIADEGERLTVTQQQIEAGIPSNMDELLAFADNYDATENGEDVLKWAVSDIFYNYYFVGQYMIVGGECGDDENNINIANEEAKRCLEIYQALNQFFYIDAEEATYDSVLEEFIEGKLVFTVVTPDAVAVMEEARESGAFAYEYGIAVMPKPSAQLGGRSLSVTNSVVVNGYSQHKELANEFAAFVTGEYVENLYARTGKLSANLSANTQDSNLMAFMKEYQNSISLPKMLETSNYWMQLEAVFARVWVGEDVETLLQALAQQIRSQFE